jgi:hypothetical protein
MSYTQEQYSKAIILAEENEDFMVAEQLRESSKAAFAGTNRVDTRTYGDDAVASFKETNGLSSYDTNNGRLQALANGASFGLANDAQGFVSNLDMLSDLDRNFDGVPDGKDWFGEDGRLADFWDASRERTADSAADMALFAEENPAEAMIFEATGALMTFGAGVAGRGAAAVAAKAGGGVKGAAAGASAVGAVDATIYGVGTLDAQFNEATDMAWHIAKSTLVGTVGGAVVGSALKGVTNKVAANKYVKDHVKALDTVSDANNVVDEVQGAFIMARMDNPDASIPEILRIVKEESDVAYRYGEQELKAIMVQATNKPKIPAKAEQATLDAHRADMQSRRSQTPDEYKIAERSRVSEKLAGTSGWLDHFGGAVNTRLSNMHQKMGFRLTEMDANISYKTSDRVDAIHGLSPLTKDKPLYATMTTLWNKDDMAGIDALLTAKGDPSIVAAWNNAKKVLDDLDLDLADVGYARSAGPKLLPRVVKDVKGLTAALGGRQKMDALDQHLAEAATKVSKQTGGGKITNGASARRVLGEQAVNEEMAVFTQIMRRGQNNKTSTLGTTKARKVDEITDDLDVYYADPLAALMSHVRRVTENVEERRFMGGAKGQQRTVDLGGRQEIDIDLGIRTLLEDSGIYPSDPRYGQAQALLVSRFRNSKVSTTAVARNIKTIGLISALANPKAAAIQIADLGHTILYNGFKNTAKSIALTLGNKNNKISVDGIGMANRISAELEAGIPMGRLAKILDTSLKYSGFKNVDRFGKTIHIKAAMLKAQKLALDPAAFNKKYDVAFEGGRSEKLRQELLDPNFGVNPSPDARVLMFSELNEIQPLSISSLPAAYHDNPNGRMGYTLKSFALKQVDQLRRNVYNTWKSGNKSEATGNLMSYMILTGASNYGINEARQALFSGFADPIEMAPEDLSMGVLWNMLGAVSVGAAGRYNVDTAIRGGVGGAISNVVIPPLGIVEAAIADVVTLLEHNWDEETMEFADLDSIRAIPVVGQMLYMAFGTGMEKKRSAYENRQGEQW